MHIFGYGFLIVCMFLAGTKALSVDTASMVVAMAEMTQVVTPDIAQSLQDGAEEEEDLLNILD